MTKCIWPYQLIFEFRCFKWLSCAPWWAIILSRTFLCFKLLTVISIPTWPCACAQSKDYKVMQWWVQRGRTWMAPHRALNLNSIQQLWDELEQRLSGPTFEPDLHFSAEWMDTNLNRNTMKSYEKAPNIVSVGVCAPLWRFLMRTGYIPSVRWFYFQSPKIAITQHKRRLSKTLLFII